VGLGSCLVVRQWTWPLVDGKGMGQSVVMVLVVGTPSLSGWGLVATFWSE